MDVLYRCGGCGKCYSSEVDAVVCEAAHPLVEDFKIVFDAEDKVTIEQIEVKVNGQMYRYNVYSKRAVEILGEDF